MSDYPGAARLARYREARVNGDRRIKGHRRLVL